MCVCTYARICAVLVKLLILRRVCTRNPILSTSISRYNPLRTKLDQSNMIASTLRTQRIACNSDCAQLFVHVICRDVSLAVFLFCFYVFVKQNRHCLARGRLIRRARVADRSGLQKQENCRSTDSIRYKNLFRLGQRLHPWRKALMGVGLDFPSQCIFLSSP